MKILIAEDDRMSRRLLENTLSGWGHEVVVTIDGAEAWAALQEQDAPQFAILDWMMPGMDGVEVCRRARETSATKSSYIILLTAKGEINDLVSGLAAGANDYIAKPFHREELRARVDAGVRMLELQQAQANDRAERRRAEEALHESEERLRQAQKLEAIGQLAGGIAHDFNNLLMAILGYCQLSLRQLHESEPLHRNINEIKKAGERAASLTRQLLAFSRKQILQPKVFSLNSLVRDLGQMLRRLIPENIEFVTLLSPETGQVEADLSQIEQALMNLVVNACDAMPEGGKIIIETANADLGEELASQYDSVQSGPHVMLKISDTGCGIDAETQEHIFEPFFTTKEVGKGTGLGLSTAYGIVKQSGGSIWVESEVGRGATFRIYLPQHMTAGEAQAEILQPPATQQGSETILLVEDETVIRNLVLTILQESGYKVLEASLASEALRICQEYRGPIHLMLTDVIMPQMSGKRLATALEELRPEIAVLYMSGYTDDALAHHGVLDPNTPLLQKPFTPEALSRKVRKILDAQVSSDINPSIGAAVLSVPPRRARMKAEG
jgi:two-component system, cell cycle sensor histidine kinase and response regulator CckA